MLVDLVNGLDMSGYPLDNEISCMFILCTVQDGGAAKPCATWGTYY